MPTLDEASRCPICKEPAQQTVSRSGSRGSKLHTYVCRNQNCRWYDTGFLVQVDSNGDVYERPKGEKEFTPFSKEQASRIEAGLEALRNANDAR